MILHKQLIIALSFSLLAASFCNANDNVTLLFQDKPTQQKVGGVVKEGSFAAVCFFVASFIMKGLIPLEYEQVASLLLGGAATLAANHKTARQVATHPIMSAKDPETAGKVFAMVVGAAAGTYGAGSTSGAKATFENLTNKTKTNNSY